MAAVPFFCPEHKPWSNGRMSLMTYYTAEQAICAKLSRVFVTRRGELGKSIEASMMFLIFDWGKHEEPLNKLLS